LQRGEREYELEFSCVLDSFRGLITSLSLLLSGVSDAEVALLEEPMEYFLRFEMGGDEIEVALFRLPEVRGVGGPPVPVWAAKGTKAEICLPFWRALRKVFSQLSRETYESEWHHPLPAEPMERLTEAIRRMKLTS
jgi:hypothetical protein